MRAHDIMRVMCENPKVNRRGMLSEHVGMHMYVLTTESLPIKRYQLLPTHSQALYLSYLHDLLLRLMIHC